MSKPFDATLKHLVEMYPLDWLRYAGLDARKVEVIDADVSAVTAFADKVIKVKGRSPYLVHFEFQASYDRSLALRVLYYSILLFYRHRLPVRSVIVLLRPKADGPAMNNIVRLRHTDGQVYHEFHYQVVRAWQQPVEEVMAGGLSTLPMAPLTRVSRQKLPEIVERMEYRFQQASEQEAGELRTGAYILLGLKYPSEFTEQLMRGIRHMKESTTWMAIFEEGEAKGKIEGKAEGELIGKQEEARDLLLRLGEKRFGPLDAQTRQRIEALDSLQTLEELTLRILEVENWSELLP